MPNPTNCFAEVVVLAERVPAEAGNARPSRHVCRVGRDSLTSRLHHPPSATGQCDAGNPCSSLNKSGNAFCPGVRHHFPIP
jgi:hypothetical protein